MKSPLLSCIVIACLVLSIPTSVYAQEQAQQKDQPQLKADRPNSYTVVKGDTLWDISTRFLEDPWRWKEIWQGNSQIANPDLIYPGDEIRLIFVAGKPQFVVNSNAPSTPSTNNSDRYSTTSDHNKPLKTVKLTPKIYSTGIKTAIPAIPLEKINAFLLRNRVVEADTLKKAAHVVAGQEKRVILSAGDSLYVRGDFSNEVNSYGLYRQGLRYHDPETSEIIGVQAVDIGAADLRSKTGDIGNFVVTRSTSEIRVGDRLLPILEREINSTFLPKPPENTVDGVIMSVEKGVFQAGKLDIVTINLGKQDQLEQGHILGIYKRGEKIRDRHNQPKTKLSIALPNERTGLILVFEVFEKMSLAIVLEAERGVVVKDIISNP